LTTTAQPAEASSSAIARPIERPAPVMIATREESSFCMGISWLPSVRRDFIK
jgi:hypothetical protein